MLSTVLVCDAADSKRQHLAVPGPFVGGLRSPNVMAPTFNTATGILVHFQCHLARHMGYLTHSSNVVLELGFALMSRCISTATSVLTDLMWTQTMATGEYMYMNIHAMTLEIKSLMIYMSLRT